MDCIIDNKSYENEVTIKDQKIVAKGGPSLLRSAVAWIISIQWKDGSTSWEKLSDMKEFYLVETA